MGYRSQIGILPTVPIYVNISICLGVDMTATILYNPPVVTYLFQGESMRTPQHTFRLEKKIIKMMDGLITNPPAVAIDEKLGQPRNRTELVEVLVRKAYDEQQKGKKAAE